MPSAPSCLVGLFCCCTAILWSGGFVKEVVTPRLGNALLAAIAALLFCAALSHAQSTSPIFSASPAYREVPDETGRTVRVPPPVNRIVSLTPSLASTAYPLGLQHHSVLATQSCPGPATAP